MNENEFNEIQFMAALNYSLFCFNFNQFIQLGIVKILNEIEKRD